MLALPQFSCGLFHVVRVHASEAIVRTAARMKFRLELSPLDDLGVEVILAALQEEREGRTPSDVALYRKRSPVQLRELTSQRKPDAHAALTAPLRGFRLVEAVEDALLFLTGNPGPCVRHLDAAGL
jgi:hypothetical protein